MSDTAVGTSGWISSVDVADATGNLASAYRRQQDKLGRVTELTRIGSLYPDLVAARLELYAIVDATPSAIPDHVRRAAALLTSVINGCLFCTVGHVERLTEAGYSELARQIRDDPDAAVIGEPSADALLEYTRKLVRTPGAIVEDDVDSLRRAGWDDLDILDVNNLVAYYCYINRVAAGLGLHGEA
jgi:uncharacterized peroxidase-related enzyme